MANTRVAAEERERESSVDEIVSVYIILNNLKNRYDVKHMHLLEDGLMALRGWLILYSSVHMKKIVS